MVSPQVDTAIIGAGIAGLACAHRLADYNKEFIVITKDIGGRLRTSDDGTVNYGAFFVCDDYTHVLKHVTVHSRIRLRDFCFHDDGQQHVLFQPRLLRYSFQFMKILTLLYKFRRVFREFRRRSEIQSQKQVIENNPFLYGLYQQKASDFVTLHHLQSGTDTYLSKGLYSTTFSTIQEMNAFSYLQFLLPLITPIYTFTFEKERLIAPFREKIILGTVTDLKYTNQGYQVRTNTQKISAKHVVLATDILWSHTFADVKQMNEPVATNMLHVQGSLKKWVKHKRYHLFTPGSDVQAIADLQDGTFLFYFKDKQPNLSLYFDDPVVIAHQFWNPAGTINGHNLIESNRGKNMYLIGDHNVAGLEESYITGLYAANQIIKSGLSRE